MALHCIALYCIAFYYIILHRIIYHIISLHIIYHIISRISYHISYILYISYRIVSYIISFRIVYHILYISYHIISYHITTQNNTCHVMSCHAIYYIALYHFHPTLVININIHILNIRFLCNCVWTSRNLLHALRYSQIHSRCNPTQQMNIIHFTQFEAFTRFEVSRISYAISTFLHSFSAD